MLPPHVLMSVHKCCVQQVLGTCTAARQEEVDGQIRDTNNHVALVLKRLTTFPRTCDIQGKRGCSVPCAAQVLRQLVLRTQRAAFAAWVDDTQHQIEKAAMLRLAAGKLRNDLCAKVWDKLPAASSFDIISGGAARRTFAKECSACLQQHKQFQSAASIHLQHLLCAFLSSRVVVTNWRLTSTSILVQAFTTMKDYAARHAAARAGLQRALLLLSHATAAKAWRSWRAATERNLLLRQKGVAVAAALQHGAVMKVWRSWRGLAEARRLLKQKGLAVVSALRLGAALRAWRTWAAFCEARRNKRQQVISQTPSSRQGSPL